MLCMVPINKLALGTLPPHRLKNASGLFNLTRNLGGAVGLAVINTVLTDRNAFHYARLSEHVAWSNPEAVTRLDNLTHTMAQHGLDGDQAGLARLSAMVHQSAWTLSFLDVFLLLTILFASLAVFSLMMSKPPAAAGAGAGH